MADTRFGSFDQLLEITASDMRPIARRLRQVILEIDPEAVEVVRLGDRASTFGLGPKKMSEGYTYVLPYDNWVNIGFYKGASLADPEGLLEGTGANMRHVKVRTVEAADQPAVRALIEEALTERRTALGR